MMLDLKQLSLFIAKFIFIKSFHPSGRSQAENAEFALDNVDIGGNQVTVRKYFPQSDPQFFSNPVYQTLGKFIGQDHHWMNPNNFQPWPSGVGGARDEPLMFCDISYIALYLITVMPRPTPVNVNTKILISPPSVAVNIKASKQYLVIIAQIYQLQHLKLIISRQAWAMLQDLQICKWITNC